MPRPPAEHGTSARYAKGCRCVQCRAAVAAYERARRARRAAEGIAPARRRIEWRKCPVCAAPFAVRSGEATVACSVAHAGVLRRINPELTTRLRPAIPKAVRAEVHRRDNLVCQLCGEPTDPEAVPGTGRYPTLDHVVPFSRGGPDTVANLRTAHHSCNSRRGARTDA